jgi:formylglycine-generating enzyme required for sulfatase activity
MKNLLAALALLLPFAPLAQKPLRIHHGCAFKTALEEADLYTFDPSDEAQRIIAEICNAVGVSQNFDIYASNVENALAARDNGRAVIMYSNVFLKKFNEDARTRWAAYSVLAHEIGHHFNNHDFGEPNPGKRKQMELEADRFAGSALRLLGATLDEAKAGIETFALEGEQTKHPSAKARRESLTAGWTQQHERLAKMGASTPTPDANIPRERDSDGDGIPDRNDACPEEYGRALTAGCPDGDEDGIPDREDKCPYRKGPTNWQGCPDTDADGLPDHEDKCPRQPGQLADGGCPPPDRDGDTVTDRADKCPDTPGLPRFQGCPDTDGDGLPDPSDKCPTEKGDPLYDGCNAPPSTPPPPSRGGQEEEVLVRGGTFQMGSNDGGNDEKPLHSVTLSDFYMGKYEVTNAEFVRFLNAKGNQEEGGATWIDLSGKYDDERCRITQSGSTFQVEAGYERHPVIFVSWYGATAYCKWLSKQTGKNYRLPTEAEWEYAAGNGSRHTKYSWGDGEPAGKKGGNVADKTAKAKYPAWTVFENYSDGYIYTAPVGQYDPNDFGLHDMTGNVWEWCSDWYDADYYQKSPSKDPQGASAGDYRVVRGGSWDHARYYCRSAYRDLWWPFDRDDVIGFRVVRHL